MLLFFGGWGWQKGEKMSLLIDLDANQVSRCYFRDTNEHDIDEIAADFSSQSLSSVKTFRSDEGFQLRLR